MKSTEPWHLKRDLFLEMKDLALKQQEVLREDRMDLFFGLSAQRNGLQRKITANEGRLKKHRTGPPAASKDPRIPPIAGEVTRIIESIQDIDQQIESFVREKRDALAGEIKGLRDGKKALKGYGGKAIRNPRFIDTKG